MRVILFANTDWYLFNYRLSLIRALRERQMEVVVVSPPGPYVERLQEAGCIWEPIHMQRRSLNPIQELGVLLQLIRIYRRHRPKLAHHFTIKCVVYGAFAAKAARSHCVVSAITGLGYVFTSGELQARLLRPMVRVMLRSSLRGARSRVIVQNADDRHSLVRAGLVENEVVRLIRGSGADVEVFSPGGQRLPDEAVKVLLATRLLWSKGVREFVQAARILLQRGLSIQFLLAGKPDLGNPDYIPAGSVAEWEAQGIIKVLGHVDEMPNLLREVDIVVLPTAYGEGVPKGLIEAASAGLPIIASDSPGCREIVEHGVNGFLIPVKDAEALAGAIHALVDDPDLRTRMGAAGRRRVMAEFDDRIVISQTLDVYRELVGIPGDFEEGVTKGVEWTAEKVQLAVSGRSQE